MWAGESAILKCETAGWNKLGGKSIPMIGSIYLAADQAGIVSGAPTVILYDTLDRDNTGLMVNTASNRLDVQRTGDYTVTALTSITGSATTNDLIASFVSVGGSRVREGHGVISTQGQGSATYTGPIALTAGNAVTGEAYQQSGSNQSVDGSATRVTMLSLVESITW